PLFFFGETTVTSSSSIGSFLGSMKTIDPALFFGALPLPLFGCCCSSSSLMAIIVRTPSFFPSSFGWSRAAFSTDERPRLGVGPMID
ncbi:hypothetical protein PMAYCL1PPCAC_25673, partial [Pristionchus mayeri]